MQIDRQDAAVATGGKTLANWQANGVSIDSRSVAASDLFVALSGPNHDGHDYVSGALQSGAAGGLVLHRDGRTFVVFAVLCLLLASDNFGRAFHGWTSPWLKPLVAVVFVGWCLWRIRTLPPRTVPSD